MDAVYSLYQNLKSLLCIQISQDSECMFLPVELNKYLIIQIDNLLFDNLLFKLYFYLYPPTNLSLYRIVAYPESIINLSINASSCVCSFSDWTISYHSLVLYRSYRREFCFVFPTDMVRMVLWTMSESYPNHIQTSLSLLIFFVTRRQNAVVINAWF